MPHKIEPFTFYRTADATRAFVVAGIEQEHTDAPIVALIEFGESRTRPIRRSMAEFQALVQNNKMIQFIPKFQ